jgi:hypothetical protein
MGCEMTMSIGVWGLSGFAPMVHGRTPVLELPVYV